jgi:hypothetical protein
MLNKGLEFKSGCNTINRGDAGDCEMAIRGGAYKLNHAVHP